MALSYDFTNIKDYKQTVWIPTDEKDDDGEPLVRMNPVTHALIFGTISVGLGSITDKNIDEFVGRFRIIEKVHGAMVTKRGEDYFITDEEFIAHIGLVTNVSNETRTQWARRLFVNKTTSVTDQYTYQFNREREKVEA